jgi:hypothetical protein
MWYHIEEGYCLFLLLFRQIFFCENRDVVDHRITGASRCDQSLHHLISDKLRGVALRECMGVNC